MQTTNATPQGTARAVSSLGTLFVLVTGCNAVAQFDDEFNVKFRAY